MLLRLFYWILHEAAHTLENRPLKDVWTISMHLLMLLLVECFASKSQKYIFIDLIYYINTGLWSFVSDFQTQSVFYNMK